MAELGEKQWELEGVLFGLGAPVHVTADGWTPGTPQMSNQDVQSAAADGVRMGKDYLGGATWGFSMFTNGETEEEAWDALADLQEVWGSDEQRLTSGAVVPLRYRLAGVDRVVYGRPRRWTATPNNLSLTGRIDVTADFATVDHRVYDDTLSSVDITLAPPRDPEQGVIPPFIPPFVPSRDSAGQRVGSVTIGGKVATPVMITINGPVEQAKIVTDFWTAQLRDKVESDNPVTLDARPWKRSVTKKQGGGAPVNPRVTKVARMLLPPGTHDIVFTGIDPTGQAVATVAWRNATRTPR